MKKLISAIPSIRGEHLELRQLTLRDATLAPTVTVAAEPPADIVYARST